MMGFLIQESYNFEAKAVLILLSMISVEADISVVEAE